MTRLKSAFIHRYFNAIAFSIIIACFMVAAAVEAHDAVVIEVAGADKTLEYACNGFVGSLIELGKLKEADRDVSETTCVKLLVERLEPKHFQHDHS